jgi:CRP-like cAMP-binding protein
VTARALDPARSAGRLAAWQETGLSSTGRASGFGPGEMLPGPGAGSAVLVTSGLVKVTAPGAGPGESARGEVLLSLRGRGDLIGEEAAVTGAAAPGRAAATAVTGGTAQVFTMAELTRFLREHPGALLLAARGLAERLAEAEARVAAAARDNADRRLARVLCDLQRYNASRGAASSGTWARLSQAELASWAGASHETAKRALRRWRERGLVRTGPCWVTVCDAAALARIAGYADARPPAQPAAA